jgi:hypothetical protein
MKLNHMPGLALVAFAFAGCSNQTAQLTGPSAPATADSRLAPGLPPIEQSSPPRIRVWTDDGWRASQKVGIVSLAPEYVFDLEVQEGQAVTFHWSAQPAGQTIGNRWAVDLDGQDIEDNTPRSDDVTDIRHWSVWSLNETTATVPPLTPGLHWVYIEARTKVGFVSLFPIRLTVVSGSDPVISQAR